MYPSTRKRITLVKFNKWKKTQQQNIFISKLKYNLSKFSDDIIREIIQFLPNITWKSLKIEYFLRCDEFSRKCFKQRLINTLYNSTFTDFIQFLKLLQTTSLYKCKGIFHKYTISFLIEEYDEITAENNIEKLVKLEKQYDYHLRRNNYGIIHDIVNIDWSEFTIETARVFGMALK